MDDFSRPPSSLVGAGSISGSARPGTAFRNANQPVRTGTATRLVAAMGPPSTASGQRIGSALNMMADRPITQHGLSGLPTGHGRLGTASGTNRQVKDKRYWQGVMQMKIQEISKETTRLMKEKKGLERDKSAKKIYEKKIRESAKELTNLQSQLTEMNIAYDAYSTGQSRQQLQSETTAYRERNEALQNQLEKLFTDRQSREDQNRMLQNEIEKERNKIKEMILMLEPQDQAKYAELRERADLLKIKNMELHSQIEAVSKQKDRCHAILNNSQPRIEAVRLITKYKELVTKRNSLKEEEETRLTPAQEREKLINEVRNNNQAITSLNRQVKIMEEELAEKRELLTQVEQDLEEGNSERHAKYKELKKRDETMTAFLETFPQEMIKEKQNIETLKNQITYAIEQMTLQGVNLKNFGKQLDVIDEKNDLSSHNGLLKEYKKLSIQLKQLQILEKRNATQLEHFKAEERQLFEDIQKYSNLDNLRSEAAEKIGVQTSQLEELRHKKRVTDDVLQEADRKLKEMKSELRGNENFRKISHLEEKLSELKKETRTMKDAVEELKQESDISDLKKAADTTLQQIMALLNENRSD